MKKFLKKRWPWIVGICVLIAAVVFLLVGVIFLLNGLSTLLKAYWISYLATAVTVGTIIYAVTSAGAIEKKKS